MEIKSNLLLDKMVKILCHKYSDNEAYAIAYLYFDIVFDISKENIVAKIGVEWSEISQNKLDKDLQKLSKGVPIQYVLGQITINDIIINLTNDVLIPRPETAELVSIIIENEKKPNLNILDIGTGSGYIAIALAKNIENSNVIAWDCSSSALILAKSNAVSNNVSIKLELVNVLDKTLQIPDKTEVIACNPPYIPISEMANMDDNVVNHEPHIALFVPDEDPLLHYRAVLSMVQRNRKQLRRLYFEVHSNFAKEVLSLFEQYYCCRLLRDVYGKHRFLIIDSYKL